MYREVEAYNQDKPNGDKPRVIDSCVTWAASGDKVKNGGQRFTLKNK